MKADVPTDTYSSALQHTVSFAHSTVMKNSLSYIRWLVLSRVMSATRHISVNNYTVMFEPLLAVSVIIREQ